MLPTLGYQLDPDWLVIFDRNVLLAVYELKKKCRIGKDFKWIFRQGWTET
jgi:hypothetical protein